MFVESLSCDGLGKPTISARASVKTGERVAVNSSSGGAVGPRREHSAGTEQVGEAWQALGLVEVGVVSVVPAGMSPCLCHSITSPSASTGSSEPMSGFSSAARAV
ncbi:hypothetical protein C8D87_105301 [Lentzea atacamensis]|uniref:Uncharacterized protein n=1 Tax=Lentzea atacamensis TaxID=531938 RepID=A0ABX9E615_9PSEU|nr:hypothetical protein C8D87_105301 [Lentzea atacamensis]